MQHPFSASSASLPSDDDAPVARLYQEHAPAILAYLRLRTSTREEAEDLLLEVFLAAVERADTLENRTNTMQRAWLRSVAAHKIADSYRRGKARPQLTLEQVAETLYADESRSPENVVLHREKDDELRVVLEHLPGFSRQVISLRFVYGLSCAQIAEALGKREGAVRKQLWRTLNRIRMLYLDE